MISSIMGFTESLVYLHYEAMTSWVKSIRFSWIPGLNLNGRECPFLGKAKIFKCVHYSSFILSKVALDIARLLDGSQKGWQESPQAGTGSMKDRILPLALIWSLTPGLHVIHNGTPKTLGVRFCILLTKAAHMLQQHPCSSLACWT